MSYLAKITTADGNKPVASTLYGTCNTAAATAAKVVTCEDFDQPYEGVSIRIKFDNGNTAQNPTININNTGAKAVYLYGSTPAGVDVFTSWKAGAILSLTYNGTAWQIDGGTDAASSLNSDKQDKTDNNLQTTAKGIVPAINEISSNLTSLGLSVINGKPCQTYSV